MLKKIEIQLYKTSVLMVGNSIQRCWVASECSECFFALKSDLTNFFFNARIKIMQNIGVSFVKMGQFSDAVTSFEHIMAEKASFQTGFNLLLCYYALGDKEKMKKTFQKLLTVSLGFDDEDKYTLTGVRIRFIYICVVYL